MKTCLIAVDIGTQGCKAALFDEDLGMQASHFIPSELISPENGTVWQEPERMLRDCCAVIKEVMRKTGIAPGSVAGISLDGQMAGIMGINEEGLATTPYDSWLDTRCGPQMARMNREAGEEIVRLSGGPASFVHGPKILWWKENGPEAYKNTAKFVLPHAYLTLRLCGLGAEDAYIDYTNLHFSCFADNRNKRWSKELLATFGADAGKFPKIVSPFQVIGTLTEEFAHPCSLLAGTPLVAGCGDSAASAFGAGLTRKGQMLDIAGTASVLCAAVDRYEPDTQNRTLVMMRSPVDGLFIPLAYINGGGMCVRWFRDSLAGSPPVGYSELEKEALLIAPGSEGLMFIPHFSGRVLPYDPTLKGAFLGLDFRHTRGHLYRAVMESIAYEYSIYQGVLGQLYPDLLFDRLLSVGGGANSPMFSQIKADVLGLDISTLDNPDTALIGGAVIAGIGLGIFDNYEQPLQKAGQPGAVYAHRASLHAAYQPFAAQYKIAIKATSGMYRQWRDAEQTGC